MKYSAPKYVAWLTVVLFAASAIPGFAQDAAKGDPSQGTGPLPPNVAPDPTPICADRPTKATTTCTVPAGAVQIETDLVNWTRDTSDGGRTDTILFTNPTFKYGIGRHTDVEVNFVPFESVRMRMDDGSVTTDRGIGDLYFRAKQKLTADRSKTQLSLVGFVKAPTAGATRGNGHWEGGVILPVNIPLPYQFTLTSSPELDVSADKSMGEGNHVELANLINLSHPVGKKATVYAELWTKQSFEPRMNEQQYSADFAASYQLTKTFEVDASAYLGLNRATPGLQIYTGVSTRF